MTTSCTGALEMAALLLNIGPGGGYARQCPVTERLSARLIRLPFYNGLEEADQARVVDAALEFRV